MTMVPPGVWCLVLSAALFRGNGVTLRTRRVIQGDDNGHVGRPGEVSLESRFG